MLTDVYFYRLMRNLTHLAVFRFHIRLVLLSGWFPNHFLETLASRCSLPLVQVCSNLVSKTMSKGRNDPRNHPRNDAIGELQVQKADAIMCLDTFSCSFLQCRRSRRRALRGGSRGCCPRASRYPGANRQISACRCGVKSARGEQPAAPALVFKYAP